MAAIVPRRNRFGQLVGYQAKVRFKGRTQSKTFRRKADAERWGRETETDIERGVFVDRTLAERTTLGRCLELYKKEVTPKKKGAARELKRIDMWLSDPLAKRPIASLEAADFVEWMARRGKRGDVSQAAAANTIRLDLALIRHLFTVAPKRWRIKGIGNPVCELELPSLPSGRDRRLIDDEEERLLRACDQSGNRWLSSFVRLLIETAMRRGELLATLWENVNLSRRFIRLPDTKPGEARDVPLSTVAVGILRKLPRSIDGRVFPLSENTVKNLFVRACQRAGITGLRMHDLRHEATSRLYERTNLRDGEVAAITGHKTLQMLKRYTNLTTDHLADKLG